MSGVTKGYDITLIACLIDSLLLSVLIFRGGIFDALTLAKELAMDALAEGIVVVDIDENILYFNEKAEQIYAQITLGKAEKCWKIWIRVFWIKKCWKETEIFMRSAAT
ncbi:hypothetical protein C823_002629 [Eubacterium plexicaudatum ASF492]|nr:hypothetical protein C823_002629 [Eubacterium plexicaudatum ASF492]